MSVIECLTAHDCVASRHLCAYMPTTYVCAPPPWHSTASLREETCARSRAEAGRSEAEARAEKLAVHNAALRDRCSILEVRGGS
jgi:hypothetical protein